MLKDIGAEQSGWQGATKFALTSLATEDCVDIK